MRCTNGAQLGDGSGTNGGAAPVLVARNLSKRYGSSTWALDDVSIELARGSISALVGPNGAGKTTLLRIWVGFEQATSGRAAVLAADPWRERDRVTAHVGYIAQQPSLYGRLSAQEHLDLALHLRPGFDRAGAARRLERLRIDPTARADHLSGGQQAQLGLVIALGTRAEVLLLDEPLASLDPLARREFLSLLLETSRELDATTVLSSHVVSDIPAVCDRLIVLAGGRVLLHDTVQGALDTHRVAGRSDDLPRPGVVGSFADVNGDGVVLLRSHEPVASHPGARAATLEEVVLGYLSAARA